MFFPWLPINEEHSASTRGPWLQLIGWLAGVLCILYLPISSAITLIASCPTSAYCRKWKQTLEVLGPSSTESHKYHFIHISASYDIVTAVHHHHLFAQSTSNSHVQQCNIVEQNSKVQEKTLTAARKRSMIWPICRCEMLSLCI